MPADTLILNDLSSDRGGEKLLENLESGRVWGTPEPFAGGLYQHVRIGDGIQPLLRTSGERIFENSKMEREQVLDLVLLDVRQSVVAIRATALLQCGLFSRERRCGGVLAVNGVGRVGASGTECFEGKSATPAVFATLAFRNMPAFSR